MLPILVTFLVRGGTFITLWMGPSWRPVGQHPADAGDRPLFLGELPDDRTMFGLNRHRRMVPVFIGAIVNLVLSLILVRHWHSGWRSAAASDRRDVHRTPSAPRTILGIPKRVFVREAWLRPMAAMVPFAIASFLIDRYWPAPTLLIYFSQIALCLPMAALGAWMISLDQEERDGATDWFDRSRAALAGSTT